MMYLHPIDPSFPRGRFQGRVYSLATGLPLASASIGVQLRLHTVGLHRGIEHLGKSDANGYFEFPSIPEAEYYAFATLPGYVSPTSILHVAETIGSPWHYDASLDHLDRVLDRVRIDQHVAATADLALQPEESFTASLAGRVTWKDGSPAKATRMAITIQSDDRYIDPRPWASDITTDDEGNFRFDHLSSGSYSVGARSPRLLIYPGKNESRVPFPRTINFGSSYYWTGNTANQAEAVQIPILAGQAVDSIDIQLPTLEQEPPPLERMKLP